MNLMLLDFLNIFCGLVLIIYGTCKLGGHCYKWYSPELIAHFCLSIGGFALMLSPFADMGIFETIIPVLGVGVYFLHKSVRTWRLQTRLAKLNQPQNNQTGKGEKCHSH